jgi:hypothetical protein
VIAKTSNAPHSLHLNVKRSLPASSFARVMPLSFVKPAQRGHCKDARLILGAPIFKVLLTIGD